MTEPYLKICHICGANMHVLNEHNEQSNTTFHFVDGQHSDDCVFKIHFRPMRYLTPKEAMHAWNSKLIK